jgi:demethylmenaquinone methyltransferase / 2-methoxy-6-polyprenyl-1,4-benzoquinol methylase
MDFRSMDAQDKISGESLSPMFGDIIRHYDFINHVFTWGMDKGWRKKLVAQCLQLKPEKFLDLGCGTGDLAINIARHARGNLHVTGYDFSRPMLETASKKVRKASLDKKISFIYGEAAQMPFSDNYFDCIGISFAFRNLIYKNPLAQRHIAEILRVLKPGGNCLIAESSQPKNKLMRRLHHFYLRTYVYGIGILVSGDKKAYKYLTESAINFYSPEEMKKMLLAAGFRQVYYRPLFFGAAGIYRALR